MDEILELLSKDARLTSAEIAKMTGQSVDEVNKTIKKYEKSGTIAGYKTLINHDLIDGRKPLVRALIEVNVSPQKDVGFDTAAERIFSFPEVISCSLVSGSYDLLLVVEGEDIQTVSEFVASKLSPMQHVQGTTTHFLLKKYKEDGRILKQKTKDKRLNISY